MVITYIQMYLCIVKCHFKSIIKVLRKFRYIYACKMPCQVYNIEKRRTFGY